MALMPVYIDAILSSHVPSLSAALLSEELCMSEVNTNTVLPFVGAPIVLPSSGAAVSSSSGGPRVSSVSSS